VSTAVNRIYFDSRDHVESSLFKPQAETARASKEIDRYWTSIHVFCKQ